MGYVLILLTFILSNWEFEVINNDVLGKWPSITIDNANNIHITYLAGYSNVDGCPGYAFYDTMWHLEKPCYGPWYGLYPSIDLDSKNLPHIAFWQQVEETLFYVYKDTLGFWHKEVVTNEVETSHITIALDNNDIPHIIFDNTHLSLYAMYHAYRKSTQWYIDSICPGTYSSSEAKRTMDIDSNNRMHLIFPFNLYLYYAHSTDSSNSNWIIDLLPVGFAGNPSLIIDALDRVHVSFCTNSIQYGLKDSIGWTFQTVYNGYGITSIAVDRNLNPHISHSTLQDTTKYSYYDGAWHTEILPDTLSWQKSACLFVDTAGFPHLAYESNFGLSHAYKSAAGITEKEPLKHKTVIMVQTYPNPFRTSLVIKYALSTMHCGKNNKVPTVYSPGLAPRSGAGLLPTICIYDVTGRLVRQWDYQTITESASGGDQITWHGDDDTGRQLRAGVYFVRLETPTQSVTRKVIKIK